VSESPQVEILLIRNDPPCERCRKTRDVLDKVAAANSRVVVREITVSDPEAAQYGAVLAPMTILNGKVVAAGMVPLQSGLEELVRRELKGE